jgi:hypothetical protein
MGFGGVPVSPGVEIVVFLQHLHNQLLPYTSSVVLAALTGGQRTDEGRSSMG